MDRCGPRVLRRLCLMVFSALTLGACATGNEEAAFQNVNALVSERTNVPVVWHRDEQSRERAGYEVRTLLSQPLTKNGAIKLAFLRNPMIQANLATIGISEADVAQAGRVKNPVLSIERVVTHGFLEINRQILFSVLSLATIGGRTEIAKSEAERARYMAALEIVGTASSVETAWVEAVAARERFALMNQIFESAKAADDLAQRMAEAGSMTELDQAKIKASLAEIAGQRGQAMAAAQMAKERLIRAMGVWGADTKFKLPWLLPRLPGAPRRFGDLERVAIAKRLDIRAARKDVTTLKETWGLTGFTSILNLLEVGINFETEKETEDGDTSKSNPKGFEVEIAIPIFDPGDAKRSRAKWVYMQSVEKLKSLAVTARSEVREAYIGYRSKLELARHYQSTVVPLRTKISEEELLRYNGMLASVFELLAATRQQAQASIMALDARRDFWLADGHIDAVLLTGSAGAMPGNGDATVVADAGGGEEH